MKDQNNWRMEMPVQLLLKQMEFLTKVRRRKRMQMQRQMEVRCREISQMQRLMEMQNRMISQMRYLRMKNFSRIRREVILWKKRKRMQLRLICFRTGRVQILQIRRLRRVLRPVELWLIISHGLCMKTVNWQFRAPVICLLIMEHLYHGIIIRGR